MGPQQLAPSFRGKVWGSVELEPWFRNTGEQIGEVWFEWPGAPLLIKFLFTTERLSVQVHPADDYARKHEDSAGKTEMWHILRASPEASIALGFKQPISAERMRESALSGEIEHLLQWYPAQAGETYFTPPGTVHALGAGLALIEIQQYSDVTYRLYDYGRPRPLHLERSMDVADTGTHPGPCAPQGDVLASCHYFTTEKHCWPRAFRYEPDPARFHVLIITEGHGALAGLPYEPGQCWLIPAGSEPFEFAPSVETVLLRTFVP